MIKRYHRNFWQFKFFSFIVTMSSVLNQVSNRHPIPQSNKTEMLFDRSHRLANWHRQKAHFASCVLSFIGVPMECRRGSKFSISNAGISQNNCPFAKELFHFCFYAFGFIRPIPDANGKWIQNGFKITAESGDTIWPSNQFRIQRSSHIWETTIKWYRIYSVDASFFKCISRFRFPD